MSKSGAIIGVIGGLATAGGIYLVYSAYEKQNNISGLPPSVSNATPGPSTAAVPVPSYPMTLPSSYPNRCGTSYLNVGPWPNKSGYVGIAKYTNTKFVTVYPQPASSNFPVGMISGGDLCGSGNQSSNTPAPAEYTYTIQYGDTLSGIAACDGTTVAILQQINGISNANAIYAGTILHLPNPMSCSSGNGGGSGQVGQGSNGNQVVSTVTVSVTTAGKQPATSLSPNSLWRVSGQTQVFIYQNGAMHWVCNGYTAAKLGLNLANVTVVSTLPAVVGEKVCATAPTSSSSSSSGSSGVPYGYFQTTYLPDSPGQATPCYIHAIDANLANTGVHIPGGIQSSCTYWVALGPCLNPSNTQSHTFTYPNSPQGGTFQLWGVAKYQGSTLVSIYPQQNPKAAKFGTLITSDCNAMLY